METSVSSCSVIDRLRQPKLLDMSLFDWITSLFGAYLIGYYIFKLKSIFSYIVWFIVWTLFGVWIHYILNVKTMLGYYLGINEKPLRKNVNNISNNQL